MYRRDTSVSVIVVSLWFIQRYGSFVTIFALLCHVCSSDFGVFIGAFVKFASVCGVVIPLFFSNHFVPNHFVSIRFVKLRFVSFRVVSSIKSIILYTLSLPCERRRRAYLSFPTMFFIRQNENAE